MAQPKKSGINWKLYGGLLVVGVIAFFMTSSSPPAVTSATPPKKKAAVAPGQAELTKADFDATPASFDSVLGSVKDTFVPIVFRAEPLKEGGPIIRSSELTIPNNFTGGEANWAFNGATQVDGKWSALVENGTSGQSDYLRVGQKWKSSTVKDITENVLILRDVSGAEKNIKMQADVQAEIAKQQADLAELKVTATRTVNSPNAPLDPGLMGQIGSGTTIQADAAAVGAKQQADASQQYQQMGTGQNGPRRRGGGRGGRGGGGYGGGGG